MNVRIRCVCAIAVLCCSLAAEATRIGNLDAKGYPVIVPTVKKLTPAPGAFALPAALTVATDAKINLEPLEKTYAAEVAGGAVRTVEGDRADCRFILRDDGVPESNEGYRLSVTPRGVKIESRSARGLFWGLQSFCWMVRNRAGDALKCCTIEDWPDLKLRGAFLELYNLKSEKMPRQIEALDGLAALKYNAVLCDFGANLPFSIADEFKRTKLTKEDVAAFVAAAKRNNIAIIPKFQVLSHALWLTYHKDWNAIKEGDPSSNWNSGYCPQNAEAQRILETVVRETCDMFEPKLFHLGLDEQKGCPHQVCEKCKDKKWADLVVGHVKPLVDLLLARGIRPIVYHDEFMNASPIRGYKDLVEVPERLGPKTIINYWLYDANPISAQYDEGLARGHKGIFMSWHVKLDNVMNLPKLAHKVGSPGCILAWWLGIQPTMEGPGLPEASAAAVLQAVYSWNASAPVYDLLPFDPQLAFVQAFPYVHARVRFASQPTPVPLGSAATALVGGGNSRYPKLDANVIRRMAKDVAPDGFRLETDKGGSRLRAAVLSGSKDDTALPSSVVLPFQGKTEGFSVLTTLAPFSTFALGRGCPPLCRLVVRYADGQEGRFNLCLRNSIAPWNAATGGCGMRFVSRVNDADGLSLSIGAAEWKNPRPEVEISALTFVSAQERDIQPVLLALAAYGAKDLVPVAKGPDRPLVDLVSVEGAPFTPLYDFAKNPDLKGLSVFCNRGQKGVKLERKIVDGPGGVRALEVVIPKDPDPVSHRFTIKFPLTPTQEFATVRYDFYCDHPEAISRADMYVHGPGWDSAIGFATFSAPGWNHLSLPRTMMGGKESGGATLGKYRDLNISFFMTPGETTTLRFTAPEVSSAKEACRIDRRARVE